MDAATNDFTTDIDLASERIGGEAIEANDEFFAGKENLVRVAAPVWKPDEFTDHGKWMDGWETRRRRTPGHDWCVVRLGARGTVTGVVVDTAYFTGNYPESCSLDGRDGDGEWFELLPRVDLAGNTAHCIEVPAGANDGAAARHVTQVRLNIYPDGGVARLRVHGRVAVDWDRVLAEGPLVDLAALDRGGCVIACSDQHFGAPGNMILPGDAVGMFDGWETRRRRGPGHDWAIVRYGRPGVIEAAVVDTSFFKGNAPGSCTIEVGDGETWTPVLPDTPLHPDRVHELTTIERHEPATHARLNIFPDGGVARLRLYGRCV